MMSVWSRRPHFLHLGLFIAAYVLGCGFAQALAIVPGTGISIWPPSGLFMATLILASRHSWPWWVLGGCLAELFSNALWFHNPLSVALLIYTGNVLEAVAGAWLVTWACRRPFRLETLQEVLTLVVLGAGIAPVASATVGSATLAWFGMQTFAAAWPLFWLGDATGVLIVAPLALAVLQNCGGRTQLSAARWMEACVLGLIFLGVAALSLSGHLPSAYIVMPPLLWAAVRFEFKGAAVALTLLALITVVFTISGTSQFVGDPEFQKQMQFALQLFLAISAFSVLTVAAVSRQHQQALLTLRDSERELSQLVDMVPSHVWRLRPDGEPIFFNKRMTDFIGLDVADLDKPGMSRLEAVIETVHPDDAAGFGDALRRSLAIGESFALRYRLRRADGVYRWMSSRAEPLRDQDGRIVQWFGLCHDIDNQVHAEEALRRSEQQLQQMIDAVPVRIWSATPTGGPVYFNKRYQDHFRSVIANFEAIEEPRIEELLQELIHPEDAPEVQRTLQNCFETGGGSSMRFRWREKDGVYRWAECRVEPWRDQAGAIAQWYGVSLDIDEEVRAQEALRERERELSQIVNMVPVHIRRLTPDGEPTFFNKRLLDFFGLSDVAQLDKHGMSRLAAAIKTLVHPEDATRLLETVRHSLATGEPYAMKYRMLRADGVYRWVDGRGEPLRDQSGAIVHWYAISIDIDDQMRLYRDLEEREAKIRRLVDSDIIGIVIWDLDGRVIDANDAFLRMVQYGREDVEAGLRWFDMTPPEWQDVHAREEAEELKATGKMQAREKEYFRKDGSRVPVLIGAACFEGQSRQGVAYILDLTERKRAEAAQMRAEEALRQAADELAKATQATSLAELSASIAHEVNQPLAAIVANSHACHRWLSAEPPNLERAKTTAERIIRDANSAADVVSRIRAVFKQSTQTGSCTALNSAMAEALDLTAEEAARRRVRIDTGIEDDLPLVALDRVQVQQVLINLMRNGMDAMDSVQGDRVLLVRARRMGDVVQTEISDRGAGIEFPDKIFEPFFTTKGTGMGMGLAICRSIVESHGGRLWAEKNEPQGATFVFTLPVEVKAVP
ncbi:MASE1 domain-containing protein [Mesorhizobium escarrei]|uniref:histidine kinase n=1 Tax=Mesorhizobium escarrei TaxID=666018 RepID=A0ABN8JN17_9HYPH|nr:MASE1 domain-containing protein [Mesorhizobium escarrei]CAH2398565.1 Histidine kinase [Mesorhizobium escarrei]